MDTRYEEAMAGLNSQQREAVETTDGPILVIAGPGTGKTQLVGTRVGYILKNTDTPADAILLLTFTEAGAQAMRDRLAKLVGRPAYDVQINTYHAFGGEVFRRYPDYFEDADLTLVEELGSDSILRGIIAKLPYSNPLKFADNYINDLKSFISEAKRAVLSPADIDKIADANLLFIENVSASAKEYLPGLARINKSSVPLFEKLLQVIKNASSAKLPLSVESLGSHAEAQLEEALEYFEANNKTTLLTSWKKNWLAKNADGDYILDGTRLNSRLKAAAGIYGQYQAELQAQHLYDYDDMILRASSVLRDNPELKYSLADQYNYIMLDEFQDTNPAQFQLVKLLTDHPVHEGRPNILAVGDDDQAIYAFQGAEQGNMSDFVHHYRDVKVISLTENYRSQPELIEVSSNIAGQIQNRLHQEFEGASKKLVAAATDLPEPTRITAREFASDAAQYDWIAGEVKKMAAGGISASEIAVLAPKHRYLQPLMPYLAKRDIPIRYERRENILDQPLILQLERMSQLVLALASGDETLANTIWPEVLSYDFWQIAPDTIWRINWQSRESNEPWTAILLNDEKLNGVGSFFLRLAAVLPLSTLEEQLDGLIGLPGAAEKLSLPLASPMYEYYFSNAKARSSADDFIMLISDLTVLRQHLRDWRRSHSQAPGLRAFVEFAEGHRAARLNILNTSPYHENEDAVNLLTAYGSKGREFQAVFIVSVSDEVWGSASRNQGYRLSLPPNLSRIRYQGASEDERLRLLYVAATRARTSLYLTSYSQDLAGRRYSRLKYLDITEDDKGNISSSILPAKFNRLKADAKEVLPVSAYVDYWQDKHIPPLSSSLEEVLKPTLARYQLSATHLNQFLDIVSAGPQTFFMQCLLAFPSAPTETSAFGTAIHNTLRFAGNILTSEGKLPSKTRLLEIFDAQIGRIDLPADEQANLIDRGHSTLGAWLKDRGRDLNKSDLFEYNFSNEGVLLNEARLAGKVDRIIVDEKTRKITVVDYKTGQSYSRWQANVVKLHKFRQQLMFYKLLIENSTRFRGYTVQRGIIEFVEPDEHGKINCLEIEYEPGELGKVAGLVAAVWGLIQMLELPDVSLYQPTTAGIRKFEEDLLKRGK